MVRSFLTPVACLLAAAPLVAGGRPLLAPSQLHALQAQKGQRAGLAVRDLLSHRADLGLSDQDAVLAGAPFLDAFGMTHLQVRQTYKGVPVWGGNAVLHVDADGRALAPTSKLVPGLDLAVDPALGASEALAIASRDMAPRSAFSTQPKPELVVVPRLVRSLRPGVTAATANANDVITTTAGADLAWHLHLDVQSAQDNRSMDYLVSASNGEILKRWNSRETAGAVAGTGNSQYSGTVSITTNQLSASSYELRDPNRGTTAVSGFGATTGSVVTDMANGTSGSGTLYTDADNTWGDGNNFDDGVTSGGTSGTTGQTAAVDAKYGFDATWDYYKNVHGRDGIDGNGTSTTLRMHYSNAYDNAFWDDGCFCMTFGDGSGAAGGGLNNLTAIDVIGHELSHGFCSNTAGLLYYDESGGLNESDSDINGTFITYYAYNGGTGATVPNTIPSGNLHGYTPWTIGSQLSNPPLRNMIKPSLDGISPDAWYFGIGNINVHYSSGPMNRAMYYLAQGASGSSSAFSYTSYLPTGMTGIGNDSASKIWFRAMTVYMTASSNYHDARIACENAAMDLFGGTITSPSTELAAVQNAFAGINVGPTQGQADDTQAPTAVTVGETGNTGLITFTGTATDNVGLTQMVFSVDGISRAAITASGATASFDSSRLVNGYHSLIGTAYDAYGNHTDSNPLSFLTLNAKTQFLGDPGFELNDGSWSFGGSQAGIDSQDKSLAHAGKAFALLCGLNSAENSFAYQAISLPVNAPSPSLTFWMRIYSDTPSNAADTLEVQVYDKSGNTLLGTLATYDSGDAVAQANYVQKTVDLSAYKGQDVLLVLWGTETGAGTTYFFLDDFSLTTTWPSLDQNASGLVDGLDLGNLAKAYSGVNPTADPNEDLNGDGKTDDADADILLTTFGTAGY